MSDVRVGRGMRHWMRAIIGAVALALGLSSAAAQQAVQMAKAEKNTLNANRVGIITGSPTGTYIKIGSDLDRLLTDHSGLSLRVVTMKGRGSVGNLRDLLYLTGVDAAIVQADVLAYMQAERPADYDYLRERVKYVTQLYNEEIHILARDGITSAAQLNGKLVAVGGEGGGTAITAQTLFRDVLRIQPRIDFMSQEEALSRLVDGRIAAMMYVSGKPAGIFRDLSAQEINAANLNFIRFNPDEIGRGDTLATTRYAAAELTDADYGAIIAPGAPPVSVLAVPAVLAVYNWDPATSDWSKQQYDNLNRFVSAFFGKIDRLGADGYNAKWCQMDLGVVLSGWQRFKPAETWLRANSSAPRKPACARRIVAASTRSTPCFQLWLDQNPAMGGFAPDEQWDLFQRSIDNGTVSC